MTDIICITCPKGCRLSVDEANDYAVTGNACPRGAVYGRNELLHPVRVVTSAVRVEGAAIPRLPVKTDRPLPKEKMMDCMARINRTVAALPIAIGDVILDDVFGSRIVATQNRQ